MDLRLFDRVAGVLGVVRTRRAAGALAATALAAAVPAAEAMTTRRPPAPQAFALVRATNSVSVSSDWSITFTGDFFHPRAGSGQLGHTGRYPAATPPKELRALIIRSLQKIVSDDLSTLGQVVDPTRVAVTLL